MNRHTPANRGYACSCLGVLGKGLAVTLKQVAHKFKPGASPATHFLLAAVLWSFIGAYLLARGALLYDGAHFWPVLVALLLGAGKARWVLARSARKNIARIQAMADNSCLGAVYSLKMWFFVLLMMLAGRGLRQVGLADMWVALVYLAVGSGLFLASWLFWRQWR